MNPPEHSSEARLPRIHVSSIPDSAGRAWTTEKNTGKPDLPMKISRHLMNPGYCLLLLAVLALSGCSSVSYFEHRESSPFIGRGMSVDVSREIFDAHPELRDGTVLIVPNVRSLAWEPNHRATVHFFAASPCRIEIDRIEIASKGRPAPAVLKVNYMTQLSKVPNGNGLFKGGVAAHLNETEGAAEVLAKSPVEMVMFYRLAGSGPWLQKRFVLKRSIKIGQTIFDILAAA